MLNVNEHLTDFAFVYKLKYQLNEIMRDQIDYTSI